MVRRHFVAMLIGTVVGVFAASVPARAAAGGFDVQPGVVYVSPEDVEEAQAILVREGYLAAGSFRRGEVDAPTAEALRDFQFVHGLRPTAVLDYETRTQLPSHWKAKAKKPATIFEGKKTLVLEGVNFETDSAKLTPDSHATLDRVAESLRDSPDVRVEIAGHTDSSGGDSHNLDLSKARAESVRDYLVSRGVDSSRLVARGYGQARSIDDNATEAGRARNRRVELTQID